MCKSIEGGLIFSIMNETNKLKLFYRNMLLTEQSS